MIFEVEGYQIDTDDLYLRALAGESDGSNIVSGESRGGRTDAEELGKELALELLVKGARAILDRLYA